MSDNREYPENDDKVVLHPPLSTRPAFDDAQPQRPLPRIRLVFRPQYESLQGPTPLLLSAATDQLLPPPSSPVTPVPSPFHHSPASSLSSLSSEPRPRDAPIPRQEIFPPESRIEIPSGTSGQSQHPLSPTHSASTLSCIDVAPLSPKRPRDETEQDSSRVIEPRIGTPKVKKAVKRERPEPKPKRAALGLTERRHFVRSWRDDIGTEQSHPELFGSSSFRYSSDVRTMTSGHISKTKAGQLDDVADRNNTVSSKTTREPGNLTHRPALRPERTPKNDTVRSRARNRPANHAQEDVDEASLVASSPLTSLPSLPSSPRATSAQSFAAARAPNPDPNDFGDVTGEGMPDEHRRAFPTFGPPHFGPISVKSEHGSDIGSFHDSLDFDIYGYENSERPTSIRSEPIYLPSWDLERSARDPDQVDEYRLGHMRIGINSYRVASKSEPLAETRF